MPGLSKVEEEKMLRGDYYLGWDPYLTQLRREAREKIKVVEETRGHPEPYIAAIRNLLGSVADDKIIIEAPLFFNYGKNTHVGKMFHMGPMSTILDSARVDIGDNVYLGPNVKIFTAEHPTDPGDRLAELEMTRPVKIGNNVVINSGATILPGAIIGDGVTVEAGSVVNREVPDNVVVSGVPAKVVEKV